MNPGKVLLEILTEDINGYLASVKGISSTHLLHPAITTIASANISSSVGSRVEPHLSECPSPLKQRRRGLGGDHWSTSTLPHHHLTPLICGLFLSHIPPHTVALPDWTKSAQGWVNFVQLKGIQQNGRKAKMLVAKSGKNCAWGKAFHRHGFENEIGLLLGGSDKRAFFSCLSFCLYK